DQRKEILTRERLQPRHETELCHSRIRQRQQHAHLHAEQNHKTDEGLPQNTSPLHEQHIVFHEIDHVLRRHEPKRVLSADIAQLLAPLSSIGTFSVYWATTHIPMTTTSTKLN
ncbi:MAG TPA: hypothetical protein VGS97_17325, partial [Actinocrinis sp.]